MHKVRRRMISNKVNKNAYDHQIHEDGIYIVGGWTERWTEMSLDKAVVILLPYKHRFSRLYAELVHSKGHSGVLTTASKICTRLWIIKLLKLVKSIKFNCVTCRKLEKRTSEQIMGKLSLGRLKPASPWSYTALDLFGPFKIRNACFEGIFVEFLFN